MNREQKIRQIWAKVPNVACKGHCYEGCTIIGMSQVERKLLEARGVQIPDLDEGLEKIRSGGDLTCPALDENKRCTVYDIRPLVCRLYGSAMDLPCPWGCEMEDEPALEPGVGFNLLQETMRVGGDGTKITQPRRLMLKGDGTLSVTTPSPMPSRRERRHPGRR